MNANKYLEEIELCEDPGILENYFGIYFDNFPILIRSKKHNQTFQQILSDIGTFNHLKDYFLNERIELMRGKKVFSLNGEKRAFGFLSNITHSLSGRIVEFPHDLYIMFQKPLGANCSDEETIIATKRMILDFSHYLLEKGLVACLGTYHSQDSDISKCIFINTP